MRKKETLQGTLGNLARNYMRARGIGGYRPVVECMSGGPVEQQQTTVRVFPPVP